MKKLFQGLPTYFGGKRRLAPWIFGHLSKMVPASHWAQMTFIDTFMGGGAMSLAAKAQGFKVIKANDWSERSQIIGRALIQNNHQRLSREWMLSVMEESPLHPIEEQYATHVFAKRHAKALDQIRFQADKSQDPVKKALYKLLLWHMALEYVCFPTSLGTSNRPYAEAMDGLRDWDTLNPKRYQDGSLTHLLKPTWALLEAKQKAINASIFGGATVELTQGDAIDFVTQTTGEILYLDPPYPGTLAYEKANQTLDALLIGEQREMPPSPFSSGVDALHALLESARHLPVWVLSYGNRITTLEELAAIVERHAPDRTIYAEAKAYQHLSHVSKTANNQELLVIATKGAA